MKYIRTKDGVYSGKGTATFFMADNGDYIENREIITQSDNIKELCDEFVVFNSSEKCVGIMDSYENSKFRSPYKAIIYGAIWTDKGLQFVARMNSEGVLELL